MMDVPQINIGRDELFYFAYGSNMSLARLQQRVPSAIKISLASLSEHQLRFHKKSDVDGSAKCDACFTGDPADTVEGVLYRFLVKDRAALDLAEGAGYENKIVFVEIPSGQCIEAFTYIATLIDASLKPFQWYKHHVLVGALENKLPSPYIKVIAAVESVQDADSDRTQREMSIYDAD